MKLGQGKSGVVYEICDMKDFMGNKETFCKMVEKKIQAIKWLVLYIDTTTTLKLTDEKDIIEFLTLLTLEKNEKLVAKIFKNAPSFTGLIQASKSFKSELQGLLECKVANGFITFRGQRIYGFSIAFKNIFKITDEYIVFYEKCSVTLEEQCIENKLNALLFYKIIQEVLQGLVKLQKKNIAHGDIKPANIMLCNNNNTWSLIDWNMWRKLTFENMILKSGVIPKHRGTSPFLYKLHGFKYLDAMKKNYVNDMMMGQHFAKIRKQGMHFLNTSIDSFDKVTIEQFEELKYSCDLHSLGLVIFAVNRLFIRHVVLDEFAVRLCIYNDQMITNAKAALQFFSAIDPTKQQSYQRAPSLRYSSLQVRSSQIL